MGENSGRLLFSIAVHERPETIIDQIENIQRFNPDCLIVLHISKQFSEKSNFTSSSSFYAYLENNPRVYVNDQHLLTSKYSPGQTHCANFLFATRKAHLSFQYFVPLNSNDLFIKSGFSERIGNAEYGIEPRKFTKRWAHYQAAINDSFTQKVIHDNSLGDLVLSYLEGTFFSFSLFLNICDALEKSGIFSEKMIYPEDELLIPSLAKKLGKNGIAFRAIENGKLDLFVNLKAIKKAEKNPNKYGVKRIDRSFTDPYRQYIRENLSKTANDIDKIIPKKNQPLSYKDLRKFDTKETMKQTVLYCSKRLLWCLVGKKKYRQMKEHYLSKKGK